MQIWDSFRFHYLHQNSKNHVFHKKQDSIHLRKMASNPNLDSISISLLRSNPFSQRAHEHPNHLFQLVWIVFPYYRYLFLFVRHIFGQLIQRMEYYTRMNRLFYHDAKFRVRQGKQYLKIENTILSFMW